jgi:hypothetical protein
MKAANVLIVLSLCFLAGATAFDRYEDAEMRKLTKRDAELRLQSFRDRAHRTAMDQTKRQKWTTITACSECTITGNRIIPALIVEQTPQ